MTDRRGSRGSGRRYRRAISAQLIDATDRALEAELLAKFDSVGIPAARYNTLPEVWEEEQVKYRGLRATTPHKHAEAGSVDLIASPLAQREKSPATIRMAPPLLGEHNAEVLGGLLGLSEDRLAELRDKGVI